MRVILFGATGMVGQGALRACLLDADVTEVLAIGRRNTGQTHPKLRELIHRDFDNFSAIEQELSGYEACLFCLGVSSAGMSEAEYHHLTYDFTLAAARVLAKRDRALTFVYVSGVGTDSSEQGRVMWARVKGKTENALLALPFKAAFMFRPGYIQPLHGIKASSKPTRVLYSIATPLYPLWKLLFPKYVTTTEDLGRAMLHVIKHGASKPIIENADIAALARDPNPATAHAH